MFHLPKYQFVLLLLLFGISFPLKIYAESAVRINEILIHPSAGNKEWIELYNPENTDVSGYWIDDDTDFTEDNGSSSKKSLATIASGQDASYAFIEISSIFNNAGDSIALFDASGVLIDQYEYIKDPGMDTALGRFPDGTGQFTLLMYMTKGERNSESLPDATATPTPTAKPTKVPTATKVPTPTKIPTSTKKVTSSQEKTPTSDFKTPTSKASTKTASKTTSGTSTPKQRVARMSGVPTSILGMSTKSAERKSPQKKKEPLHTTANSSPIPLPAIVISVGGVFLSACGILVYLKMRKRKYDD